MAEIKDRIFILRAREKLTRKAFAAAIGIKDGKVAAMETGAQRVDHETLMAICHRFEVSANWLLFGAIDGESDNNPAASFVQIPKLSAPKKPSKGSSFVADEMDVTYYAFNAQWLKRRGLTPKDLHVIGVKGDTMVPKLQHGDLILVNYADNVPSDGYTYVVRVMEELVVKHVQLIGKDAIALISANSTYPPRELKYPLKKSDFEIMGRVVASMHEW